MYRYNENQHLTINIKDFTIFSFFLMLICLIFLSVHVFIIYFYSSGYRNYKCEQTIFRMKRTGVDRIKNQILTGLRETFIPEQKVKVSLKENLMQVQLEATYNLSTFALLDDEKGKFASIRHEYIVNFNLKNLGYCKQYLKDKVEELKIDLHQVPLSQWLIYNATKTPLRFNNAYTSIFAGRVFSESDIVLNYRAKKTKNEPVGLINSYETSPYTFFTNYDTANNWVDNGLTARGVIRIPLHEFNNNTVYIKTKAEFQPYNSIYELNPLRLISDITSPMHVRGNSRVLQINVKNSDIYTSYHLINYLEWFNKISKNNEGKERNKLGQFSQYNLVHLEIDEESMKLSNSSDLEEFEEEIYNKRENWISINNATVRLDLNSFFNWYKEKYRMRISIIDRSVYKEKSFFCIITLSEKLKQSLANKEIELLNLEDIPFRSFLLFNSSVMLTSSVNINNNALAIMAEDFWIANTKNENELFINSVLIKSRADSTLNDFLKVKTPSFNTKISFKGSIIFLDQLPKNKDSSGVKEINYTWDNRFLEEKYWIRFLPSKFYLME